jgi:hypothetical protein
MKKLTIILLSIFLPMAAQADQWICVEEQGAMVTMTSSQRYADGSGETLIIDTSIGFKWLNEEDYKGSCRLLNDDLPPPFRVIVCEYTETDFHKRLMMSGNDNTFSYIEQNFGYTVASSGTCTKL